MANMVSRTLSVHQQHELLIKLEAAGLDAELAQKVIDSKGNNLAIKVMCLIKDGSFDLSTAQKTARKILGRDFVSPADIMKFRKGIVYTDKQLSLFNVSVPSQEVLKWCRNNGYMLIAGPHRPMSLLEISRFNNEYFSSKEIGRYVEPVFILKDEAETCWIMLRKTSVSGSRSKNWGEQQAMLSDHEVVPNVAEVAWCMTTYRAVRNTYLFPDMMVRTSSTDEYGYHAVIGHFGSRGLDARLHSNGNRIDCLGLAASRKLV